MRSRAAELGYANEWLELGLLDEAFLAQQLARYDAGEDTNTEHYRWAAFQQLLLRREWSDNAIADYLKLARLDGDVSVATSAIIALIDHPSLSDEQLQQLDSTTGGSAVIEKRWRRARMLRELRFPIVEVKAFRRLALEGDAEVQQALLQRQDLPEAILELLQQKGANRAIRNQAAQRHRAKGASRR